MSFSHGTQKIMTGWCNGPHAGTSRPRVKIQYRVERKPLPVAEYMRRSAKLILLFAVRYVEGYSGLQQDGSIEFPGPWLLQMARTTGHRESFVDSSMRFALTWKGPTTNIQKALQPAW
jgi:hypothetical protein